MNGPSAPADLRAAVLFAQAGDRAALERLLEALSPPLFGYLLHLLRDRALAEDALQDVLVLLYRKLPWLRDAALVRPWAFRIASREAWRRLRRERWWRARAGDEALLAVPAEAPAPPFDPELVARLPELLAEVSPGSRAVLVLHYLEELPLQETAATLDLPLGTVKSRLAYGLSQLRRRLAPVPLVPSPGEPS